MSETLIQERGLERGERNPQFGIAGEPTEPSRHNPDDRVRLRIDLQRCGRRLGISPISSRPQRMKRYIRHCRLAGSIRFWAVKDRPATG